MSKRTAALAVAFAFVIGGAVGFAWHAPGSSGTWADIRTWLGFAALVVGAGAALWQLSLQRLQLAEHQIELEQQALIFERQQAEEIDVRQLSALQGFPEPGSSYRYTAHLAEVANHSRRPIRNVVCWIEPGPSHGVESGPGRNASTAAADRVGKYAYTEAAASSGPASPVGELPKLEKGKDIPLIRAGEAGIFVFAVDTKRHPEARITTQFIDDAELHWQIDPNLHLEKLRDRNY